MVSSNSRRIEKAGLLIPGFFKRRRRECQFFQQLTLLDYTAKLPFNLTPPQCQPAANPTQTTRWPSASKYDLSPHRPKLIFCLIFNFRYDNEMNIWHDFHGPNA